MKYLHTRARIPNTHTWCSSRRYRRTKSTPYELRIYILYAWCGVYFIQCVIVLLHHTQNYLRTHKHKNEISWKIYRWNEIALDILFFLYPSYLLSSSSWQYKFIWEREFYLCGFAGRRIYSTCVSKEYMRTIAGNWWICYRQAGRPSLTQCRSVNTNFSA